MLGDGTWQRVVSLQLELNRSGRDGRELGRRAQPGEEGRRTMLRKVGSGVSTLDKLVEAVDKRAVRLEFVSWFGRPGELERADVLRFRCPRPGAQSCRATTSVGVKDVCGQL